MDNSEVKVYEAQSNFCFATFTDAMAGITSIQFCNNTTLAVASMDGVVRLYDLNRRIMFRELRNPEGKAMISIATDPNCEFIFAGQSDPF